MLYTFPKISSGLYKRLPVMLIYIGPPSRSYYNTNKMKLVVGLSLLLCVAAAVGQPPKLSPIMECYNSAAKDFIKTDPICFVETARVFKMNFGSDEYLKRMCKAEECARKVDSYLTAQCGYSLLKDICTKNEQGQYCYLRDVSMKLSEEIRPLLKTCENKHCREDPTCNNAWKKLSCCVGMYRTSSIKFGGGDPLQVHPSCTSILSTCTNVPLGFGRSTPSFLDLIMALMEE